MNQTYSDRELLLLSNFVYIPVCLSTGTIKEIIDTYRDENGGFTAESVAQAAAGGGMSAGDVAVVFDEMDRYIEKNPDFGELSVARSLEEYDVRAVCYTDQKDENPVVAFRGTGGTKEAWCDNFEGAFCEETRLQKVADDFVRYECSVYSDMTVTGHSKGGNLAQYVTVMRKNAVSSCVSFDGQGFGDDFLDEYADDIVPASSKIRSVCAYNDFVGILLTCIAGTTIYVENENSPASAHSPVTLLTANRFDENGSFVSVRSQGFVSKELERLTAKICDVIKPADKKDRETMGMIAGSSISLALTTPQDELAEGVVAPTLGLVAAKLASGLAATMVETVDTIPLAAHSVYVDTARCRSSAHLLSEQKDRIKSVSSQVDDLRRQLAYNITARICAERALITTCENLDRISRELGEYASLMESVMKCYEKSEEKAAVLMRS